MYKSILKRLSLIVPATLFMLLVINSPAFGQFSISNTTTQTITFSSTISGVSNGAYTGAGFQASPTAGQLDSDAWAVTGWSDGALAFGGTRTTGDYARGATAAVQTTGGFYAYTGAPGSAANPSFMIQPGGSDFAPGTLTLRIQNNGSLNLTQLTVAYNIFVRNDQARASSFNFSYSTDDSTYTPVGALDYTTPEAVGTTTFVQVGSTPSRSTVITGLNVAPGSFVYIRWSSADVSGSGSRDEIALDDISLTAAFAPVTTPGAFSLSSATYTVGEGDGNATVTVNRTGGSDGVVTVTVNTSDGTATGGASCGAGIDYVSASNPTNVLMFNAGETSKTFSVAICDDASVESAEAFDVTLSTPTGGATLGSPSTASVTINDNDVAAPTISVNSPSFAETDSANFNFNFTVTLSAPASQNVTIDFQTSDGTATSVFADPARDYVTTSGQLTFLPGETTKTIQVPVFGDTIPEADETFFVTLSNPINTVISNGTGTGTILNDDTYPTVQFSSATYSTSEPLADEQSGTATGVTITVNRSGNATGTSSVSYATSDGTATGGATCGAGVDYITTSGTLNFAANETAKTFFVQTCFDNVFEGDETVNLTLSNPVLATLGTPSTAILTIVENDPAPTANVQFSAATYETDEGDDTVTITVTRTGVTTGESSVNYATSNGTANGGSCQSVGFDYQTTSGTLNFAAGETSKTFSFEICSDTQSENPPETVNLTLSNPSGATLGSPGAATVRIIDAATQFVNPNLIIIPEIQPLLTELAPSVTASSSVVVAGAGIAPNRVRVTLFGFTHPTPDDLDILLVSPTGQKFVLMGDAGGTSAANNLTLTFEDASVTPAPDATVLMSGNYKPANHEAGPIFDAPAPMGPYSEPGPTGTAATLNSTFSGNPNGTWTLYLRDDTVNGNTGALTGGFGLEFIAPTAASVNLSGRVTRANGQGLGGVLVSLVDGGAGGRKYAITSSFGYYTFEGVMVGETYILSVSSKRYTFNPSSLIIDLQDGVTDANFVSQQ